FDGTSHAVLHNINEGHRQLAGLQEVVQIVDAEQVGVIAGSRSADMKVLPCLVVLEERFDRKRRQKMRQALSHWPSSQLRQSPPDGAADAATGDAPGGTPARRRPRLPRDPD